MTKNMLSGDPGDSVFTATRGGTGPCPRCRSWLAPLVDCAPTFFEKGFVRCNECGSNVDLWQASSDQAIHLKNISDSALISLGARQSWFTVPMETGQHYVLDLTQYQIPPNAKILARRYAAQGGQQGSVTAVEWYPNSPSHRVIGSFLSLLAVPVLDGPLPRTGQVLVNLTWVGPDDSDAWPYLAIAFDSAAAREYAPSLVFAQAAVEISMMPVVERRLLAHTSTDRVDRFLTEALTHNHALNVMMPYFCGEAGARPVPDSIRGTLNKLRKTRNAIIHKGAKAAGITPELAMEGLCGAAFAFEYMRFIEPFLLRRTNDRANPN